MTLIAAAQSKPLSTSSLVQCSVNQRHQVAGVCALEIHETPRLPLILSAASSGFAVKRSSRNVVQQ